MKLDGTIMSFCLIPNLCVFHVDSKNKGAWIDGNEKAGGIRFGKSLEQAISSKTWKRTREEKCIIFQLGKRFSFGKY